MRQEPHTALWHLLDCSYSMQEAAGMPARAVERQLYWVALLIRKLLIGLAELTAACLVCLERCMMETQGHVITDPTYREEGVLPLSLCTAFLCPARGVPLS